MSGMHEWLDAATTRAFWAERNPDLHIEGPQPGSALAVDAAAREALLNDILNDGYFCFEPAIDSSLVAAMADEVMRLEDDFIPLAFAYVYDEFWYMSGWASEVIGALLGEDFRSLPDIYAWCVAPGSPGWPPHRDRGFEGIRSNGMPRSLTVWIPLTDATPENGCMYCLPAMRDPFWADRDDEVEVPDLQDIRALPARAGSILGWNHALIHWGGKCGEKAAGPRISISMEYQRADEKPLNQPLLDPRALPPFEQRLGLIAKQIHQYDHMVDTTEDILAMAAELANRFPLDPPSALRSERGE